MHIRPTTLSDIPHLATLHDAAFLTDELSIFLGPNRTAHPLSWRHHALKYQRAKLYQPNMWSYVCVADDADSDADPSSSPWPAGRAPQPGTILGFARWARRVSAADAAVPGGDPWIRKLSVAERIEGWLRSAELRWELAVRTNRAVAWEREDQFMAYAMRSTGFAPLKGATHWYLDSVAVGPEFQRKGVAGRLVLEGLERVRRENEIREREGKKGLPVALIGSTAGTGLYRKLGFKVVGWEDGEFLGVVAQGGSTMVWDPSGEWIEDVAGWEGPMRRDVVEARWRSRDGED